MLFKDVIQPSDNICHPKLFCDVFFSPFYITKTKSTRNKHKHVKTQKSMIYVCLFYCSNLTNIVCFFACSDIVSDGDDIGKAYASIDTWWTNEVLIMYTNSLNFFFLLLLLFWLTATHFIPVSTKI